MNTSIQCISNTPSHNLNEVKKVLSFFTSEAVQSVGQFHRSISGYEKSPLIHLKSLAQSLGVSQIWVKDESHRYGLKSFKVLGALYAIAWCLAEKSGMYSFPLSFEMFQSHSCRSRLSRITLTAATDGNHGLAVAWAAGQLGCKAVIYLPGDSVQARVSAIRKLGCEAVVLDGNYDDAVRFAGEQAEKKDWIWIQDTALEEDSPVPLHIMQGYTTLLDEASEQLNGAVPTHFFIQCGVGSLASAMAARSFYLFKDKRPLLIVVEPEQAACYFQSIKQGADSPVSIQGDLKTIMAGLACGEASVLGWPVLRGLADYFITCSDDVAIRGMKMLAHPMNGDSSIVSGESGAVTAGLLDTLIRNKDFFSIAETLGLDEHSRILLISTEGDTDPVMYQKNITK